MQFLLFVCLFIYLFIYIVLPCIYILFYVDTQRHVGDIAYFPSIEALSGRSDGESEYEDSNDRAKRGATSSQSLLWPGGIIDYTFSSQFSGFSTAEDVL